MPSYLNIATSAESKPDLIFGRPEIFRIKADGTVVLAAGASDQDAARAFWKAVEQFRPGTTQADEPNTAIIRLTAGVDVDHAATLLWGWHIQLTGHVYDVRDVARTLTSEAMRAIGVDPKCVIDARHKNEAVLLGMREVVRALAARSLVEQEPAAWLIRWPSAFAKIEVTTDARRAAEIKGWLDGVRVDPLYTAPPAEADEPNNADIRLTPAVDLRQFLPAVEAYAELTQADATPVRFMEAGRLLNLIHSQEASHG